MILKCLLGVGCSLLGIDWNKQVKTLCKRVFPIHSKLRIDHCKRTEDLRVDSDVVVDGILIHNPDLKTQSILLCHLATKMKGVIVIHSVFPFLPDEG